MRAYEIFMVSFGLSLDVFTYALYKGAMLSRLNFRKVGKMAAVFTLWQSAAMLLGSLISEIPLIEAEYERAARIYNVLSAVIFFGIGVIMVIKALRTGEVQEHREDGFRMTQLCAWAAITSLDSFLTGIGMGFLNTELTVLVLQLAVMTLVMILFGVLIGYRIGCHMRHGALILGGAIFFAAGLDVLVRYCG